MKTMIWLGALAVLAAPAIPRAADAPGPTIAKLVAEGFEVKAVTDLTDEEQRQLWPKDQVSPFVMVTLQKTGSLAVCIVSMHDWIDGDVSAASCHLR